MAVEHRSIEADCLDGNIAFLFDLPEAGLALHSVTITNGLPEIKFKSLANVPTLTEADFATAFRLASENVRPGFAYVNFPPFHPLESRWYMHYTPGWLRSTDIGKLLADADWIMKGLQVGVRTDEAKKVYKSWKKSSHLQGLGTTLDFPIDPESTNHTIWMSCENADVQEGDEEICFPSEPKMQIRSGTWPSYSEYITKMYPSIAYHDEPKLLKMQEVIKLIIAVEWLWKKGVRVSQEWIQLHTSECTDGVHSEVLLQRRKKLPREMIPTPSNVNRPTTDARISTNVKSEGKAIVKRSEEQQFYGYYDCNSTEMKIFSESGKLLSHQKSLKFSVQHNSDPAIGLYFPITQNEMPKIKRQLCKPLPKIRKEITDNAPDLEDFALERSKSGMVQMKINKVSDSNPMEEDTLTVSATMNDDLNGMLAGMNPNDPIRPEIPGVCDAIVPPSSVSSWSELISELTVPRPSVWLYSGNGDPVLTISGGISTRDFPVRTKPLEERVPDRRGEERDYYRREGRTVTVRAQYVVAQGKIQLVSNFSAEFARVSQHFTTQWIKGTPPQVKSVFSIRNDVLMQNWQCYKQVLKSRGHTQEAEDYFHGTVLACDLVRTRALCSDGRCGICGITSAGMDSKCISRNSFQRFGQGFYLAPHSSKCGAYGNQKAMLLCQVLPGEKFPLSDRQQQLTHPPTGYDSVYGVVGSELNYPEIVIYDERAVLPKYIIIY